jgi:hypothetical protein
MEINSKWTLIVFDIQYTIYVWGRLLDTPYHPLALAAFGRAGPFWMAALPRSLLNQRFVACFGGLVDWWLGIFWNLGDALSFCGSKFARL